jgi:hypothetical protein
LVTCPPVKPAKMALSNFTEIGYFLNQENGKIKENTHPGTFSADK